MPSWWAPYLSFYHQGLPRHLHKLARSSMCVPAYSSDRWEEAAWTLLLLADILLNTVAYLPVHPEETPTLALPRCLLAFYLSFPHLCPPQQYLRSLGHRVTAHGRRRRCLVHLRLRVRLPRSARRILRMTKSSSTRTCLYRHSKCSRQCWLSISV